MKVTNEDKKLIEEAKKIIIKSRPNIGDVGAALVTAKGDIFRGVCMEFECGIGSCAEYQAVGAMISNGQNEIKSIAAVWYDCKSKKYKVIPPCGKCREMIQQACIKNKNTEVIISEIEKIKLESLLPHAWAQTIERSE